MLTREQVEYLVEYDIEDSQTATELWGCERILANDAALRADLDIAKDVFVELLRQTEDRGMNALGVLQKIIADRDHYEAKYHEAVNAGADEQTRLRAEVEGLKRACDQYWIACEEKDEKIAALTAQLAARPTREWEHSIQMTLRDKNQQLAAMMQERDEKVAWLELGADFPDSENRRYIWQMAIDGLRARIKELEDWHLQAYADIKRNDELQQHLTDAKARVKVLEDIMSKLLGHIAQSTDHELLKLVADCAKEAKVKELEEQLSRSIDIKDCI